jgi:hypothetical protein
VSPHFTSSAPPITDLHCIVRARTDRGVATMGLFIFEETGRYAVRWAILPRLFLAADRAEGHRLLDGMAEISAAFNDTPVEARDPAWLATFIAGYADTDVSLLPWERATMDAPEAHATLRSWGHAWQYRPVMTREAIEALATDPARTMPAVEVVLLSVAEFCRRHSEEQKP